MKCNNCKKQNSNEAIYCFNCGTQLLSRKIRVKSGSVDKYFSNQHDELIYEARRIADGEMIKGIIWFVIASGITLVGYLSASPGGTYYVFWGAMIYGGYRLIRGIGYKMNPESLLQRAEGEEQNK